MNPAIDEIPEGEWFCPQCFVNRSFRNLPTSSNSYRVIARTNFSERVRRNVRENRINSNLKEKTKRSVKKKPCRRKKVKRIRRKATRKTTKFKKKYKTDKISKISGSKRSIKGEKKNQILKKYLKKKKTKPKKRILRRKIKSKINRVKKNILKKLNDIDNKNNFGERNLSSSFKLRSINEEDLASIELTSQTSEYFLNNDTNDKSQNTKYFLNLKF